MRRTRGGARRWTRWSTFALILAVAVALFLRSNVALLSTEGTSMAPRFHTGDLAITVSASNYAIGDIVAYKAQPGGQVVLHRIIEKAGDEYRFKGDNNSWVDPVKPTTKDLVGKLWLRVPRAGALVNVRSRSWQIALLVIAALLIFGGGAAHRTRRRRAEAETEAETNPPRPRRPVSTTGDVIAALTYPGIAVAVTLLLAVVAFQRPASNQTTAAREYTQQVRYGYTASAPSGTTYPDGLVTTGSPIFLKLVSSLKFQLTYDVTAKSAMVHNAGGTYSIDLVVDGPVSWRRTIPLQATTPFTGQSFSSEVAVDIPQIREIVAANAAETGVKGDSISVRIVPTVNANGFIDGAPFATTFSKSLTMDIGPTTVTLSTQGKSAAPTAMSEGGDMSQTAPSTAATSTAGPTPDQLTSIQTEEYRADITKPNRFELFSRRLDVSRARLMTGAALVMALIWMAVAAATQDRLRHRSESTRITHRYREHIVEVTSLSPADQVVDVATIAALVKIADQSGRFMLHLTGGPADLFVVDDDGTRYRYVSGSPPTASTGPPEPARESPPPPIAFLEPQPEQAPVLDTAPVLETEPEPELVPEPEPEPESEPQPAAGLIVASDAPATDAPATDAVFRALLGSDGFFDREPAHDPGTPPPFVPAPASHDAGSPPPFFGVAPAGPPPPASLDHAIRLTPLTEAERIELGIDESINRP